MTRIAYRSSFLFLLDLLVIYSCYFLVHLRYHGWDPVSPRAILLMGLVGVLWFFVSGRAGILDLTNRSSIPTIVQRLVLSFSVLASGVIVVVAMSSVSFREYSKLALYPLFGAFVVSVADRLVVILTYRELVRKGYLQKLILLVGSGSAALEFMDFIDASPQTGYRIAGVLSDDPSGFPQKRRFWGPIEKMREVLRTREVDEVILALPFFDKHTIEEVVGICEHEGLRIQIVPDFSAIARGRAVLNHMGEFTLLGLREEPLSLLQNRVAKRVFDVLFSLLVLTLGMPFFLFIGFLVRVTSPGPALFKQTRVGMNNREFVIYKFRTMYEQTPEHSDAMWTTADDPRTTPVGRFLRRCNLDELPQFWNVLKGDMSVVGPRPERDHFVQQFRDRIHHYNTRHLVKSGITGLAQVNGWRGDSSIRKRVECDLDYMENWTFLLDMKIILRTLFGKHTNKRAY